MRSALFRHLYYEFVFIWANHVTKGFDIFEIYGLNPGAHSVTCIPGVSVRVLG